MFSVIIWLVKECVRMGLITVIAFSEILMGKPANKKQRSYYTFMIFCGWLLKYLFD